MTLIFFKTTTAKPYVKRSSGLVDLAFATETIDMVSIPNWVEPKTSKIGIHSFPA